MLSKALQALGSALTLWGALTMCGSAAELKVCAVPQLYLALEHLHGVLPHDFTARYDTPNALTERLMAAADTTSECDLLLSSDERLPITLIRAKKGLGSAMLPFTRAPLVLWSADPALFAGNPLGSKPTSDAPVDTTCAMPEDILAERPQHAPDPWDEPTPTTTKSPESMTQAEWDRYVNTILLSAAHSDTNEELYQALKQVKLSSLAYADAHLTPVGYATRQVMTDSRKIKKLLHQKRYEYEHEYQIYEHVRSGKVQCGFVTKPLVVASAHPSTVRGSYLTIPRRVHADIQYYVLLMEQSKNKVEAQDLMRSLRHDAKVQAILNHYGFAPLAPEEP